MIKHNEYWFVTVPEGTGRMTLRSTMHCENGSLSCYDKLTDCESTILIPPGQWQLIGLASELTEEQWRGIDISAIYFGAIEGLKMETTVIIKEIKK